MSSSRPPTTTQPKATACTRSRNPSFDSTRVTCLFTLVSPRITGGTGRYAGARGVVHATPTKNGETLDFVIGA